MVMSVCRRLLRNHHDAEDAFQATFLVLVRKAAFIVPPERVANWLHGVAYHTALKARAIRAKRSRREKQGPMLPEPETEQPEHFCQELQLLLDQQLRHLPDKYRVPIIVCDLEGRPIKEAARHLGWPQGTLAGRLARGRKMLAKRLAQRGVVLPGGLLAAAMSESAVSACVPSPLVGSTVKAAETFVTAQVGIAGTIPVQVVVLTEGVLKGMCMLKIKSLMTGLLVVGMAVAGVGVTTS
jgi:RNA polymerase sigma factor (sigma-70 family)